MKKVFWKWLEASTERFTKGKEYADVDGRVRTDCGNLWSPFVGNDSWHRIERNCFEAHGHTWYHHTPGDAMPCEPHAQIVAHYRDGFSTYLRGQSAENFRWNAAGAKEDPACDIIGWRFAGSAQTSGAETQTSGANLRTCDDETPDRFPDFAWLEFLKLAAPDVAAVEDTSLPPRIRRIVNEKEDAQAAKQQLAKDAQDKALQERADQLADAGKAMDRVNQDHGHRLGWMA